MGEDPRLTRRSQADYLKGRRVSPKGRRGKLGTLSRDSSLLEGHARARRGCRQALSGRTTTSYSVGMTADLSQGNGSPLQPQARSQVCRTTSGLHAAPVTPHLRDVATLTRRTSEVRTGVARTRDDSPYTRPILALDTEHGRPDSNRYESGFMVARWYTRWSTKGRACNLTLYFYLQTTTFDFKLTCSESNWL